MLFKGSTMFFPLEEFHLNYAVFKHTLVKDVWAFGI